ncbi:hypothetical protein FUAX_35820 [Fulvitalea axinellae]|uniref:OmpA-like domain-containing protein n=1 Tax=Fulvitalea axinellae TaxID=1182444 RepID=A0AAU9CP52_9BACT|nr:hypothetical protein FUAX_35820 [Fulvitalea axinellae]
MRTRLLVFLWALLGFAVQLKAQNQDDEREQAKKEAEAIIQMAKEIMEETRVLTVHRELFEQAAQVDPENIEANFMAGDLYLQTVNKHNAVDYLLKVYKLDPNYRFDLLYKIGQAYHFGYDFENAEKYFLKYKKLVERDVNYRGRDRVLVEEVNRRLKECRAAMRYRANPANFKIVNMGPMINSEWPDYAPVFNADETMMVFTSRRLDGNINEDVDEDNFYFEDIFISEKKDGKWQIAKNIGITINTRSHDSNLTLSPDGKILFLYKFMGDNGDIYYSDRKDDGTWTEPKPLPGRVNSSYTESSVSLSPDGKTLYFASDRPVGLGGRDIYKATKNRKGEWEKVENLGESINTEFDEDSPFIDYDGKTLYFSSRGLDGMGGYDIYRSVKKRKGWSEPENLGYPINTPDNDSFFVSTKDSNRGYYSSVREDGYGYEDLYMVALPDFVEEPTDIEKKGVEEVATTLDAEDPEEQEGVTPEEVPAQRPVKLVVQIESSESGEALDADLSVVDQSSGEKFLFSRSGGNYELTLLPDSPMNVEVNAQRKGFAYGRIMVELPAAGQDPVEIRKTIYLKRLEMGTRKVLRNVYFESNSSVLRRDSDPELNQLLAMLKSNASVSVEISGHTDRLGSKILNQRLSEKRAKSVVNYLIKKGISDSRLKAVGYGETRPLASNDDEKEGRELNRRVEFKVIKANPAL